MTVSFLQHDTRADAPSSIWRDAAFVAVMVLLTMTLPLAIYGYMSWLRFEYFSLSYFVPYEAMRAEFESATLAKVVSLPLVEMNMTSGHILANIGRFAGANDGDFEAARDAFDRSLEIARRHGDRSLERRVLTLAARVDWWFLQWEESTEKSRLALELALAAGDQQNEMYARAWLARDAAIRGDLGAARVELRRQGRVLQYAFKHRCLCRNRRVDLEAVVEGFDGDLALTNHSWSG